MFVRSVTVENVLQDSESSSGGSDMIKVENAWSGLKEILSKLANLETLVINDGPDKLVASALFLGLDITHLRVLRCSFVLDDTLLKFIAMQSRLEEMEWTGTLISLPQTQSTSLVHEQHPTQPSQFVIEHGSDEHHEDPDMQLLSTLRKYFPSNALPSLRMLRSESLALARALVPGRPVEYLWVPGAEGAAYDCFFARRTRSAQIIQLDTTGLEPIPAHPALFSPILIANQLVSALQDFGQSTYTKPGNGHGGGIQALRISLDLPPSELDEVCETISRTMPGLKTLGFVNACTWEARPQCDTSILRLEKDGNCLDGNKNTMVCHSFSFDTEKTNDRIFYQQNRLLC